ncbi:MAG: flagellar basal-body rod protein FlgG [Pseudomonadota bacterium]|jgi:flagellar basal-body rod protein FlgG|nr:flagellar basal-body rod protein FlgG [Alphaproteobacteria bacterium]
MKSLNIAATGMLAQQLNVEVISNNIANMNTTGFKRQRAEFQDLLYQSLERVGSTSSDTGTVVPSGVQVGSGVKAGSVYRIIEQGNVTSTGNPYDLAIQGRGYFQVTLPSGEQAYTRAGSFSISAEGQMVTPEGYVVGPGIAIPQEATEITINKQGQVLAKLPGQVESQNVGQLELAVFFNEAGLEAMGNNLFTETPASGAAQVSTPGALGFGSVLQGFVENSNVNPVSEITALITAQRAYEMNSKVISASDEMLSATSNLRR